VTFGDESAVKANRAASVISVLAVFCPMGGFYQFILANV